MLNLLLILFLAFMAYWWAMQGIFSAMIHLVLTILAGVITFALWEYLVYGLLLGFMPESAWGFGLLLLFGLTLLGMRVAFDKLVPGNLHFPNMVNNIGGGVLGFLSGVLTAGLLIIGLQMVGMDTIFGYRGWTLDQKTGRPEKTQGLIVPVDSIAAGFFGMLSNGSFHPIIASTKMARYHPDLAAEASLMSQSTIGDQVPHHRHTLAPRDVRIADEDGFFVLNAPPTKLADDLDASLKTVIVGTEIDLAPGGGDADGVVRILPHQVMLVHEANELGSEAQASYPLGYIQNKEFISFQEILGEYARSGSSVDRVVHHWVFQTPIKNQPLFLQIKGVRLSLSDKAETKAEVVDGRLIGDEFENPDPGSEVPKPPVGDPSELVTINDTLPFKLNKNTFIREVQFATLPTGENAIVSGTAQARKGRRTPGPGLAVQHIFHPGAARIIQVDLGSVKDGGLIKTIQSQAGQTTEAPTLHDTNGRRFYAMGYGVIMGSGIFKFSIDPSKPIKTVADMRLGEVADDNSVILYYKLDIGVKLTRLTFGEQELIKLNYMEVK